MVTVTYKNSKCKADVIMDGECVGCNRGAHVAVRKTTDNHYAVITTTGRRLVKLFDSEWAARSYCMAMKGE